MTSLLDSSDDVPVWMAEADHCMINRAVEALDDAAAEEGAEGDDDSSDASPAPLTVCKVRAVLEEVAEEWPDCGDMSEHQLEMIPRSHLQLLWLLGACRDPETGVPLVAPDGHLICAWRDAVRQRLSDPGGRRRIIVEGTPDQDRGWYWGRKTTDERRNLNPLRKIQLFGSRHNLRGQEAAALAQTRQHSERMKEIARTEALRHFTAKAHFALDQLVRDEKELRSEIEPWFRNLRGMEKTARGKIDEKIATKLQDFRGLDRMSYLDAQDIGRGVGAEVVRELLPLEDVGRWRQRVMGARGAGDPIPSVRPLVFEMNSPRNESPSTLRRRSRSSSAHSPRSASSHRERSRSPSGSSARGLGEDLLSPPTVSHPDGGAPWQQNVLGAAPLVSAGRGGKGRGGMSSSSPRVELPWRSGSY